MDRNELVKIADEMAEAVAASNATTSHMKLNRWQAWLRTLAARPAEVSETMELLDYLDRQSVHVRDQFGNGTNKPNIALQDWYKRQAALVRSMVVRTACPDESDRIANLLSWMNRRVEVEQALFNAASGKTPLPTADDCRKLALRLGDPSSKAIESACPDAMVERALKAYTDAFSGNTQEGMMRAALEAALGETK